MHDKNKSWCYKSFFSDSVVLVSFDDSFESLLKLLVNTWRITQVLIGLKLPVRGAVALDEMHVDENDNIFIGKGLLEAYDLEHSQDWIGVAIENSIFEVYKESFSEYNRRYENLFKFVFPEYNIPYKENQQRNCNRVINWRLNFRHKEGIKSLFNDDGNDSVKTKINNTIDFIKEMKKKGFFYLSGDGVPIELRMYNFTDNLIDSEKSFRHGDEL